MKGKYVVVFLALFACSLLMVPTSARAATNLGFQISAGASNVTLCDNDINFTGCTESGGTDANNTFGAITFIGALGGWNLNVDTGTGPPLNGLLPLLDITYTAVTTGTTDKLTMNLSVIGLNSPNFPLGLLNAMQILSGNGQQTTTTVTLQAFLDPMNRAFCGAGCGTSLADLINTTGSKHYDLSSMGSALTGTGPYSVDLELTIDSHGLRENETGDSQLDIPEPATLSVLGAALLGLGTGIRRKLTKV